MMFRQTGKSHSLRILAVPAFGFLLAISTGAGLQEYNYVGVATCSMCHRSEAKGNQAGKWQEGPHAKAYQTLGNDQSKEIAQAQGLANPQEAEACLGCHVTASNLPAERKGPRYKVEDGVGCESCHGPGSAFGKINIMRDHDAAVANGLLAISEETCVRCHNEKSPTFKGFDYEDRYKVIAHPDPSKG